MACFWLLCFIAVISIAKLVYSGITACCFKAFTVNVMIPLLGFFISIERLTYKIIRRIYGTKHKTLWIRSGLLVSRLHSHHHMPLNKSNSFTIVFRLNGDLVFQGKSVPTNRILSWVWVKGNTCRFTEPEVYCLLNFPKRIVNSSKPVNNCICIFCCGVDTRQ